MMLLNCVTFLSKLAVGIPVLAIRHMVGYGRHPNWTLRQDLGAFFFQQFVRCFHGHEVRKLMTMAGPSGNTSYSKGLIKLKHIKTENFEGYWINDVPKPGSKRGIILLYSHGGGYIFGHALLNLDAFFQLQETARDLGFPLYIFSLEYTLAPDAVYPKQLKEAFAAYNYLLETTKFSSDHIFIAGDSAGGNLSCALVLEIRDTKSPQPGGAILISPWADLRTEGCDLEKERLDMVYVENLKKMRNCFLNGLRMTNDDPAVSHVFADFKGVCPLMITAGGQEVLVSQIQALAAQASADGVKVELDIDPDMVHIYQLFPMFFGPNADQCLDRMVKFIWKIFSN
eukprot:Colp12_sorted_trinity150504_noHs@1570